MTTDKVRLSGWSSVWLVVCMYACMSVWSSVSLTGRLSSIHFLPVASDHSKNALISLRETTGFITPFRVRPQFLKNLYLLCRCLRHGAKPAKLHPGQSQNVAFLHSLRILLCSCCNDCGLCSECSLGSGHGLDDCAQQPDNNVLRMRLRSTTVFVVSLQHYFMLLCSRDFSNYFVLNTLKASASSFGLKFTPVLETQ